jgi:hypothetical protein
MATYTLKDGAGNTYTVDGPDGATAEQLSQVITAQQDSAAKTASAKSQMASQYSPATGGGTLNIAGFDTHIPLSDGVFNTLVGAGKGMTDLARGAGERLGLVSPDDIAQSRQQDAPLMGTTAGKVGNFTGKVVTALPAMFIPGANTLVGAAAIGAGQGALEPTTANESVLQNTAMGAGAGVAGIGAGKILGAGLRTAKAAAEPFYQAGKQAIVGRALTTAAGSDAPVVQNALEQASQPFVGPSQPGLERATMGELVSGSIPNVAQASGNAGVSALQRAAVAVNPDVTNAITKLAGQQNTARLNLLENMAGSDGGRDFAAAERAGTSDQLYGQARANGIDPAALTPEAQANIAKMQARIPDPILAKARNLAQIDGAPMDDSTSLTGLHYVKMALDDAISSAKQNGHATEARALTGLQSDFVTGIDNMSPDYATARATHTAMSEPINQMDIAQALLDKAKNPLTETLQPAAFARALNDKTAVGATGFNGATIDGTMTNQQSNLLQSLLADVKRSNSADNAGKGTGSDTVQKLAYGNILDKSGVPSFLREFSPAQIVGNVASRTADVAYGRANKELSNQLAQTMLSPEDAAAAMKVANESDKPNALLQLLLPYLKKGVQTIPTTLAVGAQK